MKLTPSILKTLVASICVFTVYILIMATMSIRQKYFPEFIVQTILYLSYLSMSFIMVANIGIILIVFYHWYLIVQGNEWESQLMIPNLISDIAVMLISLTLTLLAYVILNEGV